VLKLLSYNVLEGALPNRLPAVLRIMLAADADVVAIQEARHWRRHRREVFRKVSRRLGLPGVLLAANSGFDFAVYSRLPILRWENLGLDTVFVHTTGRLDLRAPGGETFHLFVAHLSPDHARRRRELKLLLRWLHPYRRALAALCGDLNSLSAGDHVVRRSIWADSPLMDRPLTVIPAVERAGWRDCFRLRNPSAPGLTLGARRRVARVDYIFASKPLAERLSACQVVRHPDLLGASDHSPVWATFEI